MQVSRRTATALLAVAATAGAAFGGTSAFGDHGRHKGATVFRSTLAPSVPSDPAIHGVAAGGLPWVLRSGEARLRRGGRFQVRVRGLVIPAPQGDGTPGPVMTINAALYCGNDTAAAATTGSVPISRRGDARISEHVALPAAKCLAPVILIHPNGNAAAYIAASGF